MLEWHDRPAGVCILACVVRRPGSSSGMIDESMPGNHDPFVF